MKKRIFTTMLAFVGVTGMVNAQTYKPFKVDISGGFAAPFGDGIESGPLVACEPKFGFNDHFSIGLRLESAFVSHGVLWQDGAYKDYTIKTSASAVVTGDYYFNNVCKNWKFRPFVGVGLGEYHVYENVVNVNSQGVYNSYQLDEKFEFGGMVRAGFEYSHLRLGVEYNSISGKGNSYLGVKVGVCIGGGRWRK